MTLSPDIYSASSHMMMPPDVYPPNGYLPRLNEQHLGNNFLPSVSYSLDHLDRLDYQVSGGVVDVLCTSQFNEERPSRCFFNSRVQKCCPTSPTPRTV